MEDGAASELGSTPAEVVDVVVLQRDLVVRSCKIQVPIMRSVARCRVCRFTIDVAVGDSHTARCGFSEDDVLTADLVGGNVIDPDKVGSIKSNGISTPQTSDKNSD